MLSYANVWRRNLELNCISMIPCTSYKCQRPDFTGKRKRVFGNKASVGETAAQPQNGPAATPFPLPR